MLATPVKPTPVITRERPIFTLHQTANNVLGVRLRDRPDVKTCVVSFTKYDDALRIARLIERHKQIHKEWPNFNFDYNQDDDVLRMFAGKEDNGSLRELTIFEWPSLDDVSLFCACNFMDLMKMKQIKARSAGLFRLEGDIHQLELDFPEAQKRLDDIFQLEVKNDS